MNQTLLGRANELKDHLSEVHERLIAIEADMQGGDFNIMNIRERLQKAFGLFKTAYNYSFNLCDDIHKQLNTSSPTSQHRSPLAGSNLPRSPDAPRRDRVAHSSGSSGSVAARSPPDLVLSGRPNPNRDETDLASFLATMSVDARPSALRHRMLDFSPIAEEDSAHSSEVMGVKGNQQSSGNSSKNSESLAHKSLGGSSSARDYDSSEMTSKMSSQLSSNRISESQASTDSVKSEVQEIVKAKSRRLPVVPCLPQQLHDVTLKESYIGHNVNFKLAVFFVHHFWRPSAKKRVGLPDWKKQCQQCERKFRDGQLISSCRWHPKTLWHHTCIVKALRSVEDNHLNFSCCDEETEEYY